jgi:hypothetical protein
MVRLHLNTAQKALGKRRKRRNAHKVKPVCTAL